MMTYKVLKNKFTELIKREGENGELHTFESEATLDGSTIDKVEIGQDGDLRFYYNENTNDYDHMEAFTTGGLKSFLADLSEWIEEQKEAANEELDITINGESFHLIPDNITLSNCHVNVHRSLGLQDDGTNIGKLEHEEEPFVDFDIPYDVWNNRSRLDEWLADKLQVNQAPAPVPPTKTSVTSTMPIKDAVTPGILLNSPIIKGLFHKTIWTENGKTVYGYANANAGRPAELTIDGKTAPYLVSIDKHTNTIVGVTCKEARKVISQEQTGIFGVDFTPEQIDALCEGKQVRMDGCKNEFGDTFSCYVQFDASKNNVVECHPTWFREASRVKPDMLIGDILELFNPNPETARHNLEMVLSSLTELGIIDGYDNKRIDREWDIHLWIQDIKDKSHRQGMRRT